MLRRQKGFTLIELLIVVAIVGLLASTIAVGFANARLRSRDAKRLSDMNQIKTGMDLYYTSVSGYPDGDLWLSGLINCGAQTFMQVPRDPATNIYYRYETDLQTIGCGDVTWKDYYVEFVTEGVTDLGPPGTYYIGTAGFSNAAPF